MLSGKNLLILFWVGLTLGPPLNKSNPVPLRPNGIQPTLTTVGDFYMYLLEKHGQQLSLTTIILPTENNRSNLHIISGKLTREEAMCWTPYTCNPDSLYYWA